MPNKDWRKNVGNIVIAVVILTLGAVIYFVVSGQWGSKRFRGIEKFRSEQTERFEPVLTALSDKEGPHLSV